MIILMRVKHDCLISMSQDSKSGRILESLHRREKMTGDFNDT